MKRNVDRPTKLTFDLFKEQMNRMELLFDVELSPERLNEYWKELKCCPDDQWVGIVDRIIKEKTRFPFISEFGYIPYTELDGEYQYIPEYYAERKKRGIV